MPQMVSHGISWVLGAHVRFGDLDFIITVGGELALAHAAIQPLPSIGLDYGRLECQLSVSLGPQMSREDPRCLTFSYANDMVQLAGGKPLSGTPHTQRPDSASVRSPQRCGDR